MKGLFFVLTSNNNVGGAEMIRIAVLSEDENLITFIGNVCKKYNICAVCRSRLCDETDILVLSGAADLSCLSARTCIVADTQNISAADEMIRSGNIVIGCSASPRDTLSIDSRDREKMIACLRRNIVCLSGGVCEQSEICIYAGECVPFFHALSACAVLLLCGAVPDGEIRL